MIVRDVAERGDAALREWALRLDGAEPARAEPGDGLPTKSLLALADSVRRWHQLQRPPDVSLEIAPGVELERDILRQMDFVPAISPQLRLMDAALFGDAAMDLRERMLSVPLADRIEYDAAARVLFINFEGMSVNSVDDIEAIEREVGDRVAPLGRRVDVVVNYDHFSIRPELMDDYGAMVQRLTARHYDRVTRYAASGFLKARLEKGGSR